MRRILISVFAASALLAPTAFAAKPTRERVPPFDPFVDPPGLTCPEAIAPEGIGWSFVSGNQWQTTYADGRTVLTGPHADRLTNVATGVETVLRLNGRIEFVPQPDGSLEVKLSGASGFTFFPGDVGPGDVDSGRIYTFRGNVRLRIDPSGAVVAFKSSGREQDVCALLA